MKSEIDEEAMWEGIKTATEDPEELKVICCALDSFLQYAKSAHFQITHQRRQAFYALPRYQWEMLAGPPFNYLETLDKVDAAIESNAEICRAIVKTGQPMVLPPDHQAKSGQQSSTTPHWSGWAKAADIDKARTTVRQFYRDWTAEGASEREACYGPVIRALVAEKASREPEPENPFKVLVPGAGLGRLVFELCLKGFAVEGNEISYHQLLASSYILNSCEGAGQHTIYPWVHSFSNHLTRANHRRGYAVPDIHCGTEIARAQQQGTIGTMSMVAADFLCLYNDHTHAVSYDAVATVFFLDTAPNLLRYLDAIFHCLKPGGILVNLGPLLWHFENTLTNRTNDESDSDNSTGGIADPGRFELTDDEVMALVTSAGFEVVSRETGIEAPYIHDKDSMLQMVYKASFWVARKPESKA
ncbi:N2227-like protein-domain-containing protein [Lasiosphaeria ovina]|uniref:carnosine N-methyltransferase n=1 Tax=Lasiosphaeria ovina TaxID=92902 RepID=A0AAE0JX68_9PEZI|nr:N2227-like protein-domain-containing protein [Lasiosphaeria ovina]